MVEGWTQQDAEGNDGPSKTQKDKGASGPRWHPFFKLIGPEAFATFRASCGPNFRERVDRVG